jgi:diadenosine tetraphosphatase ApaH/serine/threonine PP2A family protein phosphatase
MRYAIFSDIHANLEALEAVLAKIDEISQQEPVDEIWFLGDLVGYGPNPNECIEKLRGRTNVIIAGNHDWAAVGKIDLEDFSPAARISAEWTARQLTEEHRDFLANLPERLEFGECTLVHGSPYGPLWEYLTSELLAERSFQYFNTRYCFVGHTHVPIIFQQVDTIANTPTIPLINGVEQNGIAHAEDEQHAPGEHGEKEEAAEKVAVMPSAINAQVAGQAASAYANPVTGQHLNEQEANILLEKQQAHSEVDHVHTERTETGAEVSAEDVEIAAGEVNHVSQETENVASGEAEAATEEHTASHVDATAQTGGATGDETVVEPTETADSDSDEETSSQLEGQEETEETAQPLDIPIDAHMQASEDEEPAEVVEIAPGTIVLGSHEELLALFNLSQSLVQVTNEMSVPPEGPWQAKEGYRAIINPGGVGQPRDGDNRAAFMIYDTERGFEFYRIPYTIHKTQEKIIKAGLPSYLAARLAFGR